MLLQSLSSEWEYFEFGLSISFFFLKNLCKGNKLFERNGSKLPRYSFIHITFYHKHTSERFDLLNLQISDLPKPSYMNKTLRELRIGTYEDIETASEDTSIILALKKFVERRVSALPIVDSEGRLVDIYAKFDVIVSYKLEFNPK